jgi:polyisoprenoid-binding protein YceI
MTALAFGTTAQAAALQIDTAKSVVQWTGGKVVGGSHTGKLNLKSGSFELKDAKVVKGDVVVDMTTLVNDDLTDKEQNAKLVGHLKSPDFFDVAKFPEATLKIDGVESQAGGVYKLKGTLTIKGKSQPVAFTAQESASKDGRVVKADLTFDRAKFDVRYGSDKFFDNLGDKIIKDDVQLSVTVVLTEGKKTASK